jgi:hypothetical protein
MPDAVAHANRLALKAPRPTLSGRFYDGRGIEVEVVIPAMRTD